MKHRLRLALPPLAQLTPHSLIAFALFDRQGRLLRSGEQPLNQLPEALPPQPAHVILHPDDTIVTIIQLPAVPSGKLTAAVQSGVEPMALDELSDLCVAHGPRQPDGSVSVVWTSRKPLLEAWRLLHEAGFDIKGFIPLPLAIPAGDPHPERPLALPVDDRWRAPLPAWSLARAEWRPASPSLHWRRALLWVMAAAGVWAVGLHLYAAQLRSEEQALRSRMEQAVLTAFPSITTLLDPLRQTQAQLDQLRQGHGLTSEDDFMPLTLDTARILGFAAGHVSSLLYEKGLLTLTLAEGYQPPTDETALQRQAAAASLVLRKDAVTPHVWQTQRQDPARDEVRR